MVQFLTELPGDRSELDLVVEGATVAIPPDLENFPDGLDMSTYPPLGRHKEDPKQYRLFHNRKEIKAAGFEPVEAFYGGSRTPEQWRRVVKMIPGMRSFAAIPDDPPGVMEAVMRTIREGR